MDTKAEALVFQREITIAARPETIWELLVDPEKVVRWMGVRAWLDPRPGGMCRIEVLPGHIASGDYVELEPPRRVVFSWGWEAVDGDAHSVPPGSSRVVIELVPEGEETRVCLTHDRLPSAEATESHAHGWNHYIDRLALLAAGHDPGRDPWLDGGPS